MSLMARQTQCSCPACAEGRECCASLDEAESALLLADPAQQFIARALDVIATGVPSQCVSWCPVTRAGEPAAGTLAKVGRTVATDLELARKEYVLRYHRDDPFAPERYLDSRRPVLEMADIGGRRGLLDTAYGREFLPEFGVEWETTMYLRDGGRMLGFIRLSRATQDGDFRRSELDFLERTQPALESAYNSALAIKTRLEQ
jgi:hypothetical protein